MVKMVAQKLIKKERHSEDLKIRTKYLFHRVRMRHYALTNWKSSLPVQVGKIKKN